MARSHSFSKPPRRQRFAASIFLCLLLFGGILIFTSMMGLVMKYVVKPKTKDYTFEDDDYPDYYPLTLPIVSLTPEDTVHYQLYSSEGDTEWASVFPPGGGFVSLGPSNRPFGFALFHQMHCLTRIREAIYSRTSTPHVHHCFNYLRQSILCEADPTIEPVIKTSGEWNTNPGVPKSCKDWTKVYELAEQNYRLTEEGFRGYTK